MPRPKPPVPWRSRHPQLSVCLPVTTYARLFAQAKLRNCSAAALARDLLVAALTTSPDTLTPAGTLPPRDHPMTEDSAVVIDRSLPRLKGLPVGVKAHKLPDFPEES